METTSNLPCWLRPLFGPAPFRTLHLFYRICFTDLLNLLYRCVTSISSKFYQTNSRRLHKIHSQLIRLSWPKTTLHSFNCLPKTPSRMCMHKHNYLQMNFVNRLKVARTKAKAKEVLPDSLFTLLLVLFLSGSANTSKKSNLKSVKLQNWQIEKP